MEMLVVSTLVFLGSLVCYFMAQIAWQALERRIVLQPTRLELLRKVTKGAR